MRNYLPVRRLLLRADGTEGLFLCGAAVIVVVVVVRSHIRRSGGDGRSMDRSIHQSLNQTRAQNPPPAPTHPTRSTRPNRQYTCKQRTVTTTASATMPVAWNVGFKTQTSMSPKAISVRRESLSWVGSLCMCVCVWGGGGGGGGGEYGDAGVEVWVLWDMYT